MSQFTLAVMEPSQPTLLDSARRPVPRHCSSARRRFEEPAAGATPGISTRPRTPDFISEYPSRRLAPQNHPASQGYSSHLPQEPDAAGTPSPSVDGGRHQRLRFAPAAPPLLPSTPRRPLTPRTEAFARPTTPPYLLHFSPSESMRRELASIVYKDTQRSQVVRPVRVLKRLPSNSER